MNSNFLIQHRGSNTDSGLIYRNCGLHQFGKNPIFAKTGLDPVQYENAKNEKELLENMNAKSEPDYFEGNSETIKQTREQIYFGVPEVEIGGDTQQTYADKPVPIGGQPPKDLPMKKDIFIPVNKKGEVPE